MICLCSVAVLLIWWRTDAVSTKLTEQQADAVGRLYNHAPAIVAAVDRRADRSYINLMIDNKIHIRVTGSAYFSGSPGDHALFSGHPTWPKPPKPGEFDYGLWLTRQGFVGTARNGLLLTEQPSDRRFWFSRQLDSWRQTIISRIRRLLPDPEAVFLAGLLIGYRADLPPSLTEQLRRTGTSHVIAVSGANVVIVGGSVLWLARFILYRSRPAFWMTQASIWLFVLLTGASAAAVRGGIAASVMIIARHHGRAPPTGILIFLTAAVMLLLNPFIWADVGWQLSMAAFSGLLYFGPPLSESRGLKRLPRLVQGPAAETTAASIATLPVSMAAFGTLSLTGLIANPLILWLVPTATFAGLGGLLLGAIHPALIGPARLVAWLPLHVILTLICWLSPVPLSWQV